MTDAESIQPGTVVRVMSGTVVNQTYAKVVAAPTHLGEEDVPDAVYLETNEGFRRLGIAYVTPLEPLPTDQYDNGPGSLRDKMSTMSPADRNDLLDQLTAQIGIDAAWKLFDPIDGEIRNGENITRARTELATALGDAQTALARYLKLHDELAGELYDVEFAESGTANLALSYAKDADRALRTVEAINPDNVFSK